MKVFFNWTTVSSSILELYLIKLWVTANPKCPHDDKAQGLLNQGYVGILVYEHFVFKRMLALRWKENDDAGYSKHTISVNFFSAQMILLETLELFL